MIGRVEYIIPTSVRFAADGRAVGCMRKRVHIVPVVLLFGALLIGFFWGTNKLNEGIRTADELYQQAVTDNTALETQQNDLKAMLATASTDAFIERQARSLYGYMDPNELRLVITNPEVLYGTGE